MTYFPDLSPYEYHPNPDPAYNAGWLDESVSFPTGPTPTTFREKLRSYCRREYVVQLTMGFHTCQFCAEGNAGGNGEIRVIGTEVIYAAPTLIYHYVVDHGYQPPQEFVEAVLAGPGPGSAEHQILVRLVEGESQKPALSPEVEQRLLNWGGQADTLLSQEQLSRLLEGAKAGESLTLDELAQVLLGLGAQLEADIVSQLVANTHLARRRAGRALKGGLEEHEFGRILALDELVQILQDRLLDELVSPRMRERVAGGIIDDLREGRWNLPAPLPEFLKAYAAAQSSRTGFWTKLWRRG